MMRNKGRIIAVVLGIAVIAAVAVKLRSNRSTVESLVYENDADRAVSVEVMQARMQLAESLAWDDVAARFAPTD